MKKCSCKTCSDRGYVEVIYDDGDYIEACGECNSYNEQKAREEAIKDGYILSSGGKVLGFKGKLQVG